jgi:transcription initiation factor TFIIH subunit 1
MVEKATTSLKSYYSAFFKKQPVTIILDSDSLSIKSNNHNVIPDSNTDDSGSKASSSGCDVSIAWRQIVKHQVSPASHPKCLLKLILKQNPQKNNGEEAGAITFTFETRAELEAIRRDVTQRLLSINQDRDAEEDESWSKKRKSEDSYTSESANIKSFTDISPEMLAVTRAALLANDASLNAQHKLLVKETATLTEEDFWSAHLDQLAEECARIHGKYRKGISTSMRSNLQLHGVVSAWNRNKRNI